MLMYRAFLNIVHTIGIICCKLKPNNCMFGFFIKKDMKKKQSYNENTSCYLCGSILTKDNSFQRIDGLSKYCNECEEKIYTELASYNGFSIGLYLMCAKFDVPLEPLLIPDDFGLDNFKGATHRWNWYLITLIENNKYFLKNGTPRCFADGETNLFRIFGKEMSAKDFSTFCFYEKARVKKLAGTPRQREDWGTLNLWNNLPLTNDLYNELDRQYEQRIATYKGQSLSEQVEATLRRICKLTIAQDYLQSIGDAASFDKVQKSIDNILAAEQLRKKDEKPIENFRIDAQIKALENIGIIEKNKFLNLEALQKQLLKHCIMKKKYDYSIDVADQMISDIYNTIRANGDLFISSEIPESLKVIDEFKEFEENETEIEKENKEFAGLTKVLFKNEDNRN